MILSMTGFGRGSAATGGRKITVDLKTLNSKQLDLVVKLPNRYRRMEGDLRNRIAERAERGKIEAVVTMELTGEEAASPLNMELLKQYKAQIEEMDRQLGLSDPDDWHSVLLRLPDVMKGDETQIPEPETAAFNEALSQAIDSMIHFRRDEGTKLQEFFTKKIENIRALLAEVEPHEQGRVAKIKARLYDQLAKLSGVEIDNGRLEQELIYYIEKLDITEEKQRLTAHLDYFLQTMNEEESGQGSKGKKLGFISQEMGREINTLGSKSNNAEMQIIVVKMKDELEQIKEQVLNVL